MVVFAAIAVAISCDRGGDEVNSLPNLQLMVEVEDITTTTAKIKVSHELDAQNTWYGFVTDDTATDAATLLNEAVAKGVEAEELHRSKQYITILEELTPETSYRYIATGLTAEGVQYGEITIVEFKTLKQTTVQEEEYNGMRRNDAWTVMYVGKDRLNDVEYDHVVRVISTDNNPYAITLVYADAYDPYQLKDLADAMLVDLKNYLVEYNEQNATSFTFADMLYTGNGADPFDLDPGVYRALAVGFTPEGEVSGLFSVSDEFEVEEQVPTPNYLAWLGNWTIEGQNGAISTVNIARKHANRSFVMTGWEGFNDLEVEVEYNAELDAMFFYSQLVAEDYDLGEEYGKVDIYLFAGDEDGYYYDNKDGDYYIAIAGILDGGQRAIVRYGVNVPGYPKFTQMFFMADIGGKFYTFTKEEDLPSFIAAMK
ncbi:MAG: hypothetical protein IJE99_07570 [Alistipes sp.]|nr:hypothetical protein [Alistipes sp.]